MVQPVGTESVRSDAVSRERGVTLVELMIAMALMLIITLQLQIIFNGSRRMFTRADALMQVFQNTRSVLDLLERDIANAIESDQMEFFADNKSAASGVGYYNGGEAIPALRNDFFPGVDFVYNLSLKEPPPFEPQRANLGGPYRQDALYLRTFTSVNGVAKEALVRWELWLGADGDRAPRDNPVLRRTVIDVERVDTSGVPVLRRHPPTDACYFVQDFQVEAFFRDKSKAGVGRFYSAKQAVKGGTPPAGDLDAPQLPNFGQGETFGLCCVERGEGKLDSATAALVITDTRLRTLAPGDRLYLLTRPLSGQTYRTDFGGYRTIKHVDRTDPTRIQVHFEQGPSMQQTMAGLGVPTIDVDWRASFMPAALRITLKIKDARSDEFRTFQRIFQIKRS